MADGRSIGRITSVVPGAGIGNRTEVVHEFLVCAESVLARFQVDQFFFREDLDLVVVRAVVEHDGDVGGERADEGAPPFPLVGRLLVLLGQRLILLGEAHSGRKPQQCILVHKIENGSLLVRCSVSFDGPAFLYNMCHFHSNQSARP